MKIKPDNYLYYPKVEPKAEQAMGAFIIAWGVLEGEIDWAITSIFRLNPGLGPCVCANLGTKAKLDILSCGVSMVSDYLGFQIPRNLHSIIGKIRDHSGSARNVLAHSHPSITEYEDEIEGIILGWELTREVARKELDVTVHPVDAKYWRGRTTQIKALAQRLRNWTYKAKVRLSKISDFESKTLRGFRQKYAPAGRKRRRIRPVL